MHSATAVITTRGGVETRATGVEGETPLEALKAAVAAAFSYHRQSEVAAPLNDPDRDWTPVSIDVRLDAPPDTLTEAALLEAVLARRRSGDGGTLALAVGDERTKLIAQRILKSTNLETGASLRVEELPDMDIVIDDELGPNGWALRAA
jgi:hypothetical protein